MSKQTRARWRNLRRKARSQRRADRAFIAEMGAIDARFDVAIETSNSAARTWRKLQEEWLARDTDLLFAAFGVPGSILLSDERAGLSSAAAIREHYAIQRRRMGFSAD